MSGVEAKSTRSGEEIIVKNADGKTLKFVKKVAKEEKDPQMLKQEYTVYNKKGRIFEVPLGEIVLIDEIEGEPIGI